MLTLVGKDGADILIGGAGNDWLDGGDGTIGFSVVTVMMSCTAGTAAIGSMAEPVTTSWPVRTAPTGRAAVLETTGSMAVLEATGCSAEMAMTA
jgi:hypothetical protein